MAPEALNDLLNAVAPARRQFLKTILTGTAFAAPLMASFSMDGLSVDAASAATCGNMTGSVADFTMNDLSCSNMGSWGRHPRFKAKLLDGNNHHRGNAEFEFDSQRCVLEYKLHVDKHLVTVNFGTIGVPSAVLVVHNPPGEYVLGEGKGEIGVALPCLTNMNDLLVALDTGQAEVVVLTETFEASGTVQSA